jgi:hypothetical protein
MKAVARLYLMARVLRLSLIVKSAQRVTFS